MTLPDDDRNQRALGREWAAARIVVIGGIVVALAVLGYFAWRERQEALVAQQPTVITPAVAPKIDAKVLRKIEIGICNAELDRAKELTILPSYAVLASANLIRANGAHRFICEAQTHLTRYFISADILCDKIPNILHDARCISVYRIALKDGRLVYSRPQ